jgi:flagellar hook-associated protein 1 FlgK
MANILATLRSSATSLDAYSQVLEVTQNNVANASTPGFAKQSLPLEAMQMDLEAGSSGGVTVGQVQSARDEFSEQAVRTQNTGLGWQQQKVASLQSLQSAFDVSGNSGIDKALNGFFQSVSAWGQTPNDQTARQTVINSATDVAQRFQDAATALQNQAQNTDGRFRSTVDQVNQIVAQLQAYNHMALQTGSRSKDPGVDAQIHSSLESLSQLVDFSATKQRDGTITVLMNGSTPLLIGDRQYTLHAGLTSAGPSAAYPDAPASEQLRAGDGTDITSQSTGGQLGAVLDMRNRVLASYIGDSNQPGSLNRMAQQFADRVNQLLTSGNISDGPPPVAGVPLFTYDTVNGTNVAKTLAVDPSVTPDQLAAVAPGPPYVSNGVPLALSQLATPQNDADKIDGFSYTQFYGNMAANIGTQLQSAQNNVQVQQSLLAQAQNQRQQLSGVDLNQEAMIMVEFQRAYQANSQLVMVLDELTRATINLLGPVA